MPPIKPIKQKDLIKHFKKLGFEGPYSGGKHPFMIKGNLTVTIPNPHNAEISPEFLLKILKQCGISKTDWEKIK